MIYFGLNKNRNGGMNYMLGIIAKIGAAVAATPFTVLWFYDETDCPKSLIK